MVSSFIAEFFSDERRRRDCPARANASPARHRTAVDALERYLTCRGMIRKGDVVVDLLGVIVGIAERAAAKNAAVGEVTRTDLVRFADTLLERCAPGEPIDPERQRLVAAITRAEATDGRTRS